MQRPSTPDMPRDADPDGAAFRLVDARAIAAVLNDLCAQRVALELRGRSGEAVTAALATVSTSPATLAFRSDATEAAIDALRACGEIVASGWLQGVEIRFAARALERLQDSPVLRCAAPAELQRFQRRDAFRVRPPMRSAPSARLMRPGTVPADLRVLDVSIGGCALFLPHDLGPFAAGTVLDGVELDLDADTRLQVRLRLLHATVPSAEARGAHAGCAFVELSGAAQRALQRYIDTTQKRARLLAGR